MKSQTGFTSIEIIVAVIAVAVSLAVGVLMWQKTSEGPSIVIPSPTPAVFPTPTPTSASISTPTPTSGSIIKPKVGNLLEKITLSPGQTVKIENTDLSITLSLMAIPAGECFDCPAQFNLEVKNQGKTEQLNFSISEMTTEETLKKIKTREVFGFRIIIIKYGLEGVTLTVERL